jgi:hypothetical protein
MVEVRLSPDAHESNMAYTITPSADGKYIVMKVTGEITRELAMQENLAAHSLGRELGITRFFVDVTEARNAERVVGNYDFAHGDMRHQQGIDKDVRVAMLVNPEDHSHDFIEIVLRNAGHNVTLFRDRELAMRHLW